MRKNLWVHGLVAAAIGGAVTALSSLLLIPADVRFDLASLQRYAATAAGGAVVAVLAYFRQSPVASGTAGKQAPQR